MNTHQRVYIAGSVGWAAAAAGLANLVRLEYYRHSRLEPEHVHIETERFAAAIAQVPRSFDEVYQRAQERARGEHALNLGIAVIAAVSCAYMAYRSLRRIFR